MKDCFESPILLSCISCLSWLKKSYDTTHRRRSRLSLTQPRRENIAKLTKERRRRAGKKIREEREAQNSSREVAKSRRKEEQAGQLFSESEPLRDFAASCEPSSPPDFGFRVFKLDSTNIREWDPNRDNLAESLEASVDHLKSNRSEQDICPAAKTSIPLPSKTLFSEIFL